MSPCRILLFISILLLPATTSFANEQLQQDRDSAHPYLNRIRKQAGLQIFKRSKILDASAANHARYLSANRIMGHSQARNGASFTGANPGDRAVFAGYSSRAVTENFSVGQVSTRQSIDNLMSAIYHRFAFLDVSKNQLGVGIAHNRTGLVFVYNMGNDRLNHFCRNTIHQNSGPFYTDTCSHGGRVSVKEFERHNRAIGRNNPQLIVWPPEEGRQIPTAFYEEVPDPLPDYQVSGYPVSAQVNPFFFKKVTLQSFKLFYGSSKRELAPVRLLTQKRDPNQRFTPFDFALFPLNRLTWDTEYRAEIVLTTDSHIIRKRWHFRTAAAAHPMFIIAGHRENLKLKADHQYLVHIPSSRKLPYIEQLRWESLSGVETEVVWQDRNTLKIRLTGDVCESTRFILNGNRSFTVQVAKKDNLNDKQVYRKGPVTGCVIDTIKDLPGFRITAHGDVIQMQPDRDYWVEIAGLDKPVTEVKWQLADKMSVQVHQLNHRLLKIRISGEPGRIATFFISNSRIFKVVVTK